MNFCFENNFYDLANLIVILSNTFYLEEKGKNHYIKEEIKNNKLFKKEIFLEKIKNLFKSW